MTMNDLECTCCGGVGAVPDDRGRYHDGHPLVCGCDGHVSMDAESPPYVSAHDCPCSDPEALRDAWMRERAMRREEAQQVEELEMHIHELRAVARNEHGHAIAQLCGQVNGMRALLAEVYKLVAAVQDEASPADEAAESWFRGRQQVAEDVLALLDPHIDHIIPAKKERP